ncbi:hypothetical protein BACI9J_130809 [Bacillus altitudinis]|nr:hypothetical protein BACI9J_130809 [Bacillus altitudinis]
MIIPLITPYLNRGGGFWKYGAFIKVKEKNLLLNIIMII